MIRVTQIIHNYFLRITAHKMKLNDVILFVKRENSNYIFMNKKLLIILVLSFSVGFSQYSPLYLQQTVTVVRNSDTQHSLIYPLTFDQVQEYANFSTLFCFMPLITNSSINITTMNTCNFTNKFSSYSCIRLFSEQNDTNTTNTNYEQLSLDLSETFSPVSSTNKVSRKKLYQQNSQRLLQTYVFGFSLAIKKYQIEITFNSASLQNSFMRLVSCQQYAEQSNSCESDWKQNYMHFYTNNFQGNILMQRYHACATQNLKEVHVFYGGILRENEEYMMFGIVAVDHNSTQMRMWGGIDYSNDHASRDMFCYNNKGEGADSISFVAGPVYSDANETVGATDDTIISSNSYEEGTVSSSHFIQYYRKYDTGDFSGDQKIRQRIYGKYAFAAYFSTQYDTSTPSCFNNKPHNFVFQFDSFVDIHEFHLSSYMALLIIYALLF